MVGHGYRVLGEGCSGLGACGIAGGAVVWVSSPSRWWASGPWKVLLWNFHVIEQFWCILLIQRAFWEKTMWAEIGQGLSSRTGTHFPLRFISKLPPALREPLIAAFLPSAFCSFSHLPGKSQILSNGKGYIYYIHQSSVRSSLRDLSISLFF